MGGKALMLMWQIDPDLSGLLDRRGPCMNNYGWTMLHRGELENNFSYVNLLHSAMETTQGLRSNFTGWCPSHISTLLPNLFQIRKCLIFHHIVSTLPRSSNQSLGRHLHCRINLLLLCLALLHPACPIFQCGSMSSTSHAKSFTTDVYPPKPHLQILSPRTPFPNLYSH